MNESHSLQINEISAYQNFASIAFKSGLYKGLNEMQIVTIMLTAREFGIAPFRALNNGLGIINGKVFMYTSLMVELIRSKGHSIKILDGDWTTEKCTITGVRKDNADFTTVTFSIQDAQRAQLLSNPVWSKYPKAMLYNRAMSQLARMLFPDCLGNCYTEDEKQDIINKKPEEIDYPSVLDAKSVEVAETIASYVSEPTQDLADQSDQATISDLLKDIEDYIPYLLKALKIKSMDELKKKNVEHTIAHLKQIRAKRGIDENS